MVKFVRNTKTVQQNADDISLRGSGITTREIKRTTTRYEKESEKSLEKGADKAAAEAKEKFEHALDDTIAALERDARSKNITLDPSQISALKGCLKNQVCCLIGPAGSGKTTLEKIIIRELAKMLDTIQIVEHEYNEETDEYIEHVKDEKAPGIAVAAFTGRAAQQSRKAIGDTFGIPISTIHRLLGYAPTFEMRVVQDPNTGSFIEKEIRVFRPTYNAGNKLPYLCYILDESSMIPVPLFNELIDAMLPNARIIMVGDIHQLPPVMSTSAFGFALQKWPVFELTKIHRQTEGSAIINNSHRILKGLMPQKADNFHMLKAPGSAAGSLGFSVYIRQVAQSMMKIGAFDPFRDVIIVPNSNPDIITSSAALNKHFMTAFNPEKKVGNVIINKRIDIHTGTGRKFFAIGDKIMLEKNLNTVNPPLTNGMMGIIENISVNGRYDRSRADVDLNQSSVVEIDDSENDEEISFDLDMALSAMAEEARELKDKKDKDEESQDQRQASHITTIKFETGQTLIASTSGDYRALTFGYAITAHKSQGGEYNTVIIALHSASGNLLSQEWLYTAVTRARENCFLVFNDKGIQRALRVQKIKGNTLEEKIARYTIESKTAIEPGQLSDPWNVDRKRFPILFLPKEM